MPDEIEGMISSEDDDDDHDLDNKGRIEQVLEKLKRRSYTPYKFSGKSYSFDTQQETMIINQLREWQTVFFTKSKFVFKQMSKELKEIRDSPAAEFDLLVKILKIFERDEYNIEMRIKDCSNEMWFITIPKLKFGHLREGEIVRIRSVKLNITSKRNVIEMKPSTNILRFTQKNAIVQEMRQKVGMETIADKMMLEDDSEIIMSPVMFTEITVPDYQKLPLFKLDDLFLNYDEIPLE